MKALIIIALLILSDPCAIYSLPPDADKSKPAAVGRPIRFVAYEGEPKMANTKPMSFQITLPNLPTEFLNMGAIIPGTHFKLTKFEFKTRRDARGDEVDISELTLTHIETNETVVLLLGARQSLRP